jgi:hypothetical protein
VPSVSHTEPIDAPADAVWRLVGDFAEDSWTGVAITCEGAGTGAVRTVAMPSGDVVERCDHHDDGDRRLAYTVLEGNPFPVSSCSGEVHVAEAGAARSEVRWTIAYETDADRPAVERDLSGLLRASAGALRAAAER